MPTQSPNLAAAQPTVVSVRMTSSLVMSWAKDPIPRCASCLLNTTLSHRPPCLHAAHHRSCMAHTAQRDKNMRSKCSTRVTSSATTSSIPPLQRKIPSSGLALAIQALCVCIGHFRMNGVSVSMPLLLLSCLSRVHSLGGYYQTGPGQFCQLRVDPAVSVVDFATMQVSWACP